MNPNPDLNRCPTFRCKIVIQLSHSRQNFPAGANCVAGVIGTGVAHAENRHEAVAQIFVYHPAMPFLDHAHSYPKKIVHHFDHIARDRHARSCGPGTHVHKHNGDLFLNAAQPGVVRQNLFGCALADVQTECLPQFFLISKLANHVVEFAQQAAKFVRPRYPEIDIEPAT